MVKNSANKTPSTPGRRVQSVDRALDILEHVAREESGAGLSELARLLGISAPAVLNLAGTLVERGYLERAGSPPRYLPGRKLPELAQTAGNRSLLRRIGGELLRLSTAWPDMNFLAVVPAGADLLLRFRLDPTRPAELQTPLRPVPNPYGLVTSLCLMAFLPADQMFEILRRYPPDEFAAPPLGSRRALERKFAAIRRAGGLVTEDGRPRAAYPILDATAQAVAAIGASAMERDHCSRVEFRPLGEDLRAVAENLSEAALPSTQPRTKKP